MDKINEMIKRGANVNCHDEDSQATALMWACYQGHLNVVSRLLSLNSNKDSSDSNAIRVNIEDRDKDGYTALHWAVIHKQPEVVKLLLSQGNADVNAKNKGLYVCVTMFFFLMNSFWSPFFLKKTDLETPLHKASQVKRRQRNESKDTHVCVYTDYIVRTNGNCKDTAVFQCDAKLEEQNQQDSIGQSPQCRHEEVVSELCVSDPHEGESGEKKIGEKEDEQHKNELLERGMIDNEMILKQQWREDVRNWFKQLALSEYADLFLDNGYDRLDVIVEINEEELKQLGIKAGHIKVITKAIADIKAKKEEKKEEKAELSNIQNVNAAPQENPPQQIEEREKEENEVLPNEIEPGQ
ncbi:hypothetical protein RFI_23181 [Reticulomyxa filosa]|uniref:SAM domain-containing protein n=1 Tax=Reticulomyxa filosa TaxID=46433 RepID=X6MJJ7_RETFI|nr:hypothetical protein RFI_23181 [Reticulomyxa filosa]|eukprot:ETO14188.1 hypothetical protein RFI_23181 [Reticulomyxa filosa]